MVLEAELLIDGVDQANHADDLVGELLGGDEQMGVVLVEAADAEQAVERTPELVSVDEADLTGADGQLAIAMRL